MSGLVNTNYMTKTKWNFKVKCTALVFSEAQCDCKDSSLILLPWSASVASEASLEKSV